MIKDYLTIAGGIAVLYLALCVIHYGIGYTFL